MYIFTPFNQLNPNNMKIIETKVFKLNELSDDAKKTAIETQRDINVDYSWWEFTYDDAKTIGLKITSFDLDRNMHAEGDFILSANEVAANILSQHGETCETHKTAKDFMKEWQPVFDECMETEESEEVLAEIESKFLDDILRDYSVILQNESEYLQSDEAVIETIEANDYDFTEDGRMH